VDSLKPRFALEAHLANLFAGEDGQAAEETEQAVIQEVALSIAPTVRPYGLLLASISNGCSKSAGGGVVRSQQKPFVPSF
jgi:hypothetical protein